jgi:predicted small metal-binding protein
MKQFACGSVVPGCTAVFMAEEEDDILRQVAEHARADHGITDVSPELVSAVRANISAVN